MTETPIEIVEMEMEVSRLLKKGLTKITREGGLNNLTTNHRQGDYRQNCLTRVFRG